VQKGNKGIGQVKPARFGLQEKFPSYAIAKYIHVLILKKVLPLVPQTLYLSFAPKPRWGLPSPRPIYFMLALTRNPEYARAASWWVGGSLALLITPPSLSVLCLDFQPFRRKSVCSSKYSLRRNYILQFLIKNITSDILL